MQSFKKISLFLECLENVGIGRYIKASFRFTFCFFLFLWFIYLIFCRRRMSSAELNDFLKNYKASSRVQTLLVSCILIEASLSERNLVKGTVMSHGWLSRGASRAGDRLRQSCPVPSFECSLSLSECVSQGTITQGGLCRSPHTSVGREVGGQGDR